MFYRYNRGPRGRMFGHRGNPVGVILAVIGLIFFSPIAFAVLIGLLCGAAGVIGGLAAAAAGILSGLRSVAFPGGGLIVGIVIGLILYNRNRSRKTEAADREETSPQAEEEYYPTQNYRSFGE